MIEAIGGRKFVFAILITALAFVLTVLGNITYEQFINAALWALGIFSTTNVASKIVVK